MATDSLAAWDSLIDCVGRLACLELRGLGGAYSLAREVRDGRLAVELAIALPVRRRTGDGNVHSLRRIEVVSATLNVRASAPSHERELVARVARHLAAAERVRRAPDAVVGQVSREDAPAGLWDALLAGEQALVPQSIDEGEVVYDVLQCDDAMRTSRVLNELERSILGLAAAGKTLKEIAYEVKSSTSIVSTRLATAAAKVGAISSTDLLRMAGLLRVCRHEPIAARLTNAEREVLGLVGRGMTNEEIAHARGRSVRTIANQIASLLGKTGYPSRRAFLVAPLRAS